jgi:DNA-binding phage protein
MALTHDPKETFRARARRNPTFRQALLSEAITAMLEGDSQAAKALLRDYVVGTIGFPELEIATHIPEKSLMRMLSSKGNPRMANIVDIIVALQKREGVRFELALKRAS